MNSAAEPITRGEVAAHCLVGRWARHGIWRIIECDPEFVGGFATVDAYGAVTITFCDSDKQLWITSNDSVAIEEVGEEWSRKTVRAALARTAAFYLSEADLDFLMEGLDELAGWRGWW